MHWSSSFLLVSTFVSLAFSKDIARNLLGSNLTGKDVRVLLRGDCPDGYIDASLLSNSGLGCLYFDETLPTVAPQAKDICDDYDGGEVSNGGPPGSSDLNRVEPKTLEMAEDLFTLAGLVQKDRTAWWLGLQYYTSITGGGWAWSSDASTAIDIAIFSSIFTPDDKTPNADDKLFVVMASDSGKLKWDDVGKYESSYGDSGIGAICECEASKCPLMDSGDPDPTAAPTIPTDCLSPWLLVAGLGCVQIVTEAKGSSYETANSECEKLGGYLVEITTEDQVKELKKKEQLLQLISGADTFWLGPTDAILDNVWWNPVSETQLPETAIPWAKDQPDGEKSENCLVAIVETDPDVGYFYDVPCDSTDFNGKDITPICMEATSTATESPTAGPTASPTVNPTSDPALADCKYMSGVNSPCYLYKTDTASWEDADTSCKGQGGELASVLTQEENDFIGQSVIEYESVWLGGQGSGSGGFTWTDSSTWSFTNWKTGEPGSSSTSECIYMSASTWQWSAYDCAYSLGYVCKISK